MKKINRIIFKTDSSEEFLPGYLENFQHIASYVELDQYREGYVPWHWHNTLELFYMESGTLEYFTPNERQVFPAGSGGLVNTNVLHMTKFQPGTANNIQLLHLFDPVFISGESGNRIDCKYVTPFTNNPSVEMLALSPEIPEHVEVLKLIRESFELKEDAYGYEIRLRGILSEIWLRIFEIAGRQMKGKNQVRESDDRIKQMLLYIHEHYAEKLSVAQLANTFFMSERACYRIFQKYLHMTPVDYIRSYRLQMACQMLKKDSISLAEIGQACGLGSSSYFGKQFKEKMGCTPLEYKQKMAE